jgi:hypothetical protein
MAMLLHMHSSRAKQEVHHAALVAEMHSIRAIPKQNKPVCSAQESSSPCSSDSNTYNAACMGCELHLQHTLCYSSPSVGEPW